MGVKPCSSAMVAPQASLNLSSSLPDLSTGDMILGYAESVIRVRKVSMNSISESAINFILKFVERIR